MKPIDAVGSDAAKPLSALRVKLFKETSEAFAKKDVFPPAPPTPAQVSQVQATHPQPKPQGHKIDARA